MKRRGGGIVYSSAEGRLCPSCGRPVASCSCRRRAAEAKAAAQAAGGDGVVRVRRETKGRKGQGVTTVSGVPLGGAELKALARQLKKKCGAGGALKNGIIEIQGDHRIVVVAVLEARGWTVKLAGG